jgi:hypothetical protein
MGEQRAKRVTSPGRARDCSGKPTGIAWAIPRTCSGKPAANAPKFRIINGFLNRLFLSINGKRTLHFYPFAKMPPWGIGMIFPFGGFFYLSHIIRRRIVYEEKKIFGGDRACLRGSGSGFCGVQQFG